MLTPEELAQLSGAEELFPSPIPVQFVSSDEFMPRREHRAHLRLCAEVARGAARRQGRVLQESLRQARRRPHEPRLRLHQQGMKH